MLPSLSSVTPEIPIEASGDEVALVVLTVLPISSVPVAFPPVIFCASTLEANRPLPITNMDDMISMAYKAGLDMSSCLVDSFYSYSYRLALHNIYKFYLLSFIRILFIYIKWMQTLIGFTLTRNIKLQ
jgi:hypothetical protein